MNLRTVQITRFSPSHEPSRVEAGRAIYNANDNLRALGTGEFKTLAGKAVGFMALSAEDQPIGVALVEPRVGREPAYLSALAVLPDLKYRPEAGSHGIGTMLLDACHAELIMQEKRVVTLQATTDAIPFYEKHNYEALEDATPGLESIWIAAALTSRIAMPHVRTLTVTLPSGPFGIQ